MRGSLVLAGMVVAAGAAVLIWLDATDQLRPWLSTSPQVFFELEAAPTIAEDEPVEAATVSEAELPSDADDPIDPDAAATDTGADAADQDVTETVGDAADAAVPETELAADFGEGAIALSDVPIASGDDGATADAESSDAGGPITESTNPDSENASADEAEAEPAEDAAGAVDVDKDDADSDDVAEASDEPAADAEASETASVETADAAEPTEATDDSADPATETIDPDAVQTAALPTLSSDPNLPWRLYATPFADGEPRPRIAIVFVSLGLSDGATEAIIQQLPGAVTLAFSPYSRKLPDWIARARAKGHEVLVELPMEPLNYPDDDPGPLALLDDRPIEDNVTRLDGILDRAEGAVGVAAQMGSRFTGDEALIGPILEALGERGFLYVDNSTSPASVVPALSQQIAVPIVLNDHYLDTEVSRIAIDGRLQQIERIARSEGAAVAFAMPYPITIERLLAWIPTLEAKGFVLAPVTAVVGHQEVP